MLFENLDKKIKEAAEQHYPAYDEKAWQKMEHLLSQHLPQKKDDRRRIIFFLLVFLLVGGGAFVLISNPWHKKPVAADQSTLANKKNFQTTKNEKTVDDKTPAQPNADKINKEAIPNEKVLIDLRKEKTVGSETTTEKSIANKQKNKTEVKSQPVKTGITENKNKFFVNSDQPKTIVSAGDDKKTIAAGNAVPPIQPVISRKEEEEKKKEENKTTSDIAKQDEIKENKENIKQEIAKTEIKKEPKKNKKPGSQNGFSFSASVGSDVSKAGSSKTGKTTLVYGAGIGYTRNRFSLRTGVYASKKIYWAGPNDYKLFYSSPTYKFEGADANCYVINIPVKLSYNFKSTTKDNWFAGAGLSSYLMKRETYVYNYKTNWGSPITRNWEVKNENKHYFSILNLSGGYTRRINNTFSISAEPYAEIPLTGIGEGKVHLNSGGVLMTLNIKPFRK